MAPEVLRAKLRQPRPAGLVRRRLLDTLVGPDAPPLSLVVAPAGSGKTTLLSQAVSAGPWRSAWYEAGPEDRTAARFVVGLWHAIAAGGLRDDDPPSDVTDLIAAFDDLDADVMLVIDDVHELEGSPAAQVVEQLVRLRPDHLRLSIGSRRLPQMNLPRLMLSGDVVQLDGESLRFRSWEVEDLFRSVFDEPLSPEAAAALTRTTGGWAAGLQLFHLATAGKPAAERERAVADLGGRSRLLRSYLTRNVLDVVDPERRHFLLVTNTLGVLTGPLCDALLGTTGSAAVLDELEQEQFFTTSSEDGHTYRYHQVLATHLEGVLIDEVGAAKARVWHARSAALLEQHGHRSEAMRAYALADDWASVGRLIQSSRMGLPAAASWKGAEAALPDDDPWLAMVRARRLLRDGAMAQAVIAYRQAELMHDDPDFQARCRDEREIAELWLPAPPVLRPRVVDARDPRALAFDLRAVLAAARGREADPVHRHMLVQTAEYLLEGSPARAVEALDEGDGSSGSTAFEALAADLMRVVAQALAGTAHDVVARLESVALAAGLEEQSWLARLGRGLLEAWMLVTPSGQWRVEAAEAVEAECQAHDDPWGAMLMALALGVAHLARGDDGSARRWLARGRARARDLGVGAVEAWSASLEGWLEAGCVRPTDSDPGLEVVAERLTVVREGHALEHAVVDATSVAGTRLVCLGQFALVVDGAEADVTVMKPRARTLLCLLALHHGRDVHREVLMEALWPGAPPEAATHRLHVAASGVRKWLGESGSGTDSLQRHGDSYRLQVDDAAWDVAEFDGHLQRAGHASATGELESAVTEWAAALDLYGGDLLPEAGPAEWVVVERDRLRFAATEAAIRAARGALSMGRTELAVRMAHRAVQLDPLRDSSWLLLASAQDAAGDCTAASETRRQHVGEADNSSASSRPLTRGGPGGATAGSRDRW